MGQMTDSDEDGVFEHASAPSIQSRERARRFGPHLVRERMQNAEKRSEPLSDKTPAQAAFRAISPGGLDPLIRICNQQVVGSTPAPGSGEPLDTRDSAYH